MALYEFLSHFLSTRCSWAVWGFIVIVFLSIVGGLLSCLKIRNVGKNAKSIPELSVITGQQANGMQEKHRNLMIAKRTRLIRIQKMANDSRNNLNK